MDGLAVKLHPNRFPNMSGKMAAIVAYVLGEHWTDPELAELAITSDGLVLGREDGDVGCNTVIGSAEDLGRNVRFLITMAGLTDEERAEWDRLYRTRVADWRYHLQFIVEE